MTDKTFEEYRADADKYLFQKDMGVDLVETVAGLQKTFPKKPEPRDYFYLCYMYMHRSSLPMAPDELQNWGWKIKQAFKHIDDLAPKYQDENRLILLKQGRTAQLPTEDLYKMAKKAEEGVAADFVEKGEILKIKYQMASRYFADVVKEAGKAPDYKSELSMYKKAYNVLFDIMPSARYETYKFFRGKLKDVYMQSEWGRREWNHDEALMRNKVYKSLPKEIKFAMNRNMDSGRGY